MQPFYIIEKSVFNTEKHITEQSEKVFQDSWVGAVQRVLNEIKSIENPTNGDRVGVMLATDRTQFKFWARRINGEWT